MKKIFTFRLAISFAVILLCIGNAVAQTTTIQTKSNNNKSNTNKYTYKIISASENTFGYEIITNGKTLVHQENIPSMPGNKGFNKKEQSEKCARFVISKLEKNIMPPTVTPKELDLLGVLK